MENKIYPINKRLLDSYVQFLKALRDQLNNQLLDNIKLYGIGQITPIIRELDKMDALDSKIEAYEYMLDNFVEISDG